MSGYGHIDIPPVDDCKNPDSYGMICVKCNECGRFDKKTPADTANIGEGQSNENFRDIIPKKG